MASRIELPPAVLKEALEFKEASIKRARNTSKNPKFQALYDDDLRALQASMATITEIK